ncbi:MAG: peptidoglycan-binding domain-containing protein [Solirubrobacteraceae bacterium]
MRASAHRHAGKKSASRKHSVNRGANPFAGRAMWIWELSSANGGNLASIIASAHQRGIGTLYIKSSDGANFWSSQFSPQIVAALHAGGLRVCAWQYVYGNQPVTEAYMGAEAIKDGADCLLIDAESEYEGKYIAAQTYVQRLRKLVGSSYPVGLAGFPYVDFHPAFPYSVFLGPGGAQYNVPQMYWKDIGTTVDAVFAHTYSFNRIYERPIFPLGQVYSSPPPHQIVRFRQLSRAYGASGISWWDWQEATPAAWSAVSRPVGALAGYAADTVMASFGKGAQGDLVVWAQEHLISAGYATGVDGGFGVKTQRVVESFQTAHGLTPDGIVGPATWAALLRYPPARIVWGSTSHALRAGIATASGRGAVRYAPVPKSASRPAKRDEIAGAGGSGRPPRR